MLKSLTNHKLFCYLYTTTWLIKNDKNYDKKEPISSFSVVKHPQESNNTELSHEYECYSVHAEQWEATHHF